ncbi:hypothetical protein GALMADRAFT_252237 [Galerina marginata CBS 339.88]|uniref:Uncharacterized protein n=1 Tax=Galerina marginata (strain CBS 339.88) TaxID=685588 RepID=A0A067SPP1_GALM3|nr:hypothetical protein GALMADRAFT_252237 [Galerina marginata CBS 339.88]
MPGCPAFFQVCAVCTVTAAAWRSAERSDTELRNGLRRRNGARDKDSQIIQLLIRPTLTDGTKLQSNSKGIATLIYVTLRAENANGLGVIVKMGEYEPLPFSIKLERR